MDLLNKIKAQKANIGVIGLGYVGLPLSVEKAKAGFVVLGFDVQCEKVEMVNRGENYIGDVVPEELTQLVASAISRPRPISTKSPGAMSSPSASPRRWTASNSPTSPLSRPAPKRWPGAPTARCWSSSNRRPTPARRKRC